MQFSFNLQSLNLETLPIELQSGTSSFFVGANGSGKTRLAAQAEGQLGEKAHRISAHRSLSLNSSVAKIAEKKARAGLRFGYADVAEGQGTNYRSGQRWSNKAETSLLNDFDFLLQTLFADQTNVALQTHTEAHAGTIGKLELTLFQKLTKIWDRILPHRTLEISGDEIRTIADGKSPYDASDMSDGERAVFYMLGQVLAAEPDSVLIFDEPEIHVHRAILSRLWDEVEAARPDCALLVITHDLEFAASRPGQKFVIRRFQAPSQWEIERVPENTGFSEEVATLILGSRQPILFVEGTEDSLDLAIYRACYSDWTVLPRGACENVIHSVATMRRNMSLTRVTCAGVVDADDHGDDDKQRLSNLGVATLPVSEIENLFLLPMIATAILEEESFQGAELASALTSLNDAVLREVCRPGAIDEVVLRYCRRKIDRALKGIDLTDTSTPADLANLYRERTAALDVVAIAKQARDRIEEAIRNRDLPALLANFDNKSFLRLAANQLKKTNVDEFRSWLNRVIRDPKANLLKAALNRVLPTVTPS